MFSIFAAILHLPPSHLLSLEQYCLRVHTHTVHSLKGVWTRWCWGRYKDIRYSNWRGETCIMKSFMICTGQQILGWSTEGGWSCWDMSHIHEGIDVRTQICWVNLKGRNHLEHLDADETHQNGCQDTGLGAEEWSDAELGQMAGCVDTLMNPQVPQNTANLSSLETIRFSNRTLLTCCGSLKIQMRY